MARAFHAFIASARAKWPSLPMNAPAFERHLARVAEPDSEARAADLFLAFMCSVADAGALAAFERDVLPAALRAVKLPREVDLDEVRQLLRERLLVGKVPKIATYSGAGSLVAWVATVAARTGIDLTRKAAAAPRERVDEDLQLAGASPELEYLKRHYEAEFKQAFRRVLDALPREDRRLLRLSYLEGLTADVVARMMSVHRMTVGRRIARLRELLADETRRGLSERLGVRSRSLDSVMKLMNSGLDASIRRALETKSPDSRS